MVWSTHVDVNCVCCLHRVNVQMGFSNALIFSDFSGMNRTISIGRNASTSSVSSVTRHPPTQIGGRGDSAKTDELTAQVRSSVKVADWVSCASNKHSPVTDSEFRGGGKIVPKFF